MGQLDSCSKKFLNHADVFADVCNVFLFDGKVVVHPEDLTEKSGEEIYLPESSRHGTRPLAVSRDLLKDVACKTIANGTTYLIIGIESQSGVDRSMPLRILFYDVLRYMDQLTKLIEARRAAFKNAEKGEEAHSEFFLSRMSSEERLTPVITIVLYMSPEPWDGPKTFHELLALSEPELAQLKDHIVDYRLNIIEPCNLTDEMLARFKSDFGPVMKIQQMAGRKSCLTTSSQAASSKT